MHRDMHCVPESRKSKYNHCAIQLRWGLIKKTVEKNINKKVRGHLRSSFGLWIRKREWPVKNWAAFLATLVVERLFNLVAWDVLHCDPSWRSIVASIRLPRIAPLLVRTMCNKGVDDGEPICFKVANWASLITFVVVSACVVYSLLCVLFSFVLTTMNAICFSIRYFRCVLPLRGRHPVSTAVSRLKA